MAYLKYFEPRYVMVVLIKFAKGPIKWQEDLL